MSKRHPVTITVKPHRTRTNNPPKSCEGKSRSFWGWMTIISLIFALVSFVGGRL
jgi:hypothetical protein